MSWFRCNLKVDNSQDILQTIQALYHDQQMCDVFLTVGKKEHPAHRLILCAFSDVFQVNYRLCNSAFLGRGK